MARRFTNGFEINSAAAGMDWLAVNNAPSSQATTVRSGSRAGQVAAAVSGDASGWLQQFVQTAATGPYFVKFAFRYATLPASATVICALSNAIAFGSIQGADPNIKLTSTGTLQLFNGATQIGADSAALTANTWYEIEMWYDDSLTAGSKIIKARINQAAEFAASTTITAFNTSVRTLFLGLNLFFEANATGNVYFDDVAVNDSTGGQNNGYVGTENVITLFANASGDANAWLDTAAAAGTTNNYTLVDENPPNDATDMVQNVTASAQDLYNFANSGIASDSVINVVEVYSRHRNNTADATTSFALVAEKTGSGTKSQGATLIPNTTTWRTGSTIGSTLRLYPSLSMALDPDGAAWTQATIDSMQAGPKGVAAGTNRVQVSAVWVTVGYKAAPVGGSYTSNPRFFGLLR